jgi:CYTH domain-containing protein
MGRSGRARQLPAVKIHYEPVGGNHTGSFRQVITMKVESERRFLVVTSKLPSIISDLGPSRFIRTSYFLEHPAMRVQIFQLKAQASAEKAKFAIKTPTQDPEDRNEFEYVIPTEDAEALIKVAPTYLEKVRIFHEGWEVDHFLTPGIEHLWIAEYEKGDSKPNLPDQIIPGVNVPGWIGQEITGDKTYSNAYLAFTYGRKSAQ